MRKKKLVIRELPAVNDYYDHRYDTWHIYENGKILRERYKYWGNEFYEHNVKETAKYFKEVLTYLNLEDSRYDTLERLNDAWYITEKERLRFIEEVQSAISFLEQVGDQNG